MRKVFIYSAFRLLISGGAEVFNLKIPIRNPEKIANTIGYIFVSEQNVAAVVHLLEYGVLCIRPEFIGDYLIMVRRYTKCRSSKGYNGGVETYCSELSIYLSNCVSYITLKLFNIFSQNSV